MTTQTSWDWLGDPLALDVANTVRRRGQIDQELWVTGADVAAWAKVEQDRLAPVPAREAGERLDELHQLRDAVLGLLRATVGSALWNTSEVDLINKHVLAHAVVPQLDRESADVVLLPLGGARDQAGVHDRVDALLGQIATATLTFLSGPDRQSLALCDAPGCGQLFLRRRSNQNWCCNACGNRARVARHSQHHAQ